MLVSVLPVPFADAGRQRQYEAVLAALAAEADAPATVLLGNLGAFSPIQADMLVVRPQGFALGVLLPQAGQLTIPALAHSAWLLDGQPLPGHEGADNPFAQYQQQLPVALDWLSEHLGVAVADLPPGAGFALFEAPLTFGPGVEAQLHRHAATTDFQLIGEAGQVPARLPQPTSAALTILDANELLEWGEYLAHEAYATQPEDTPEIFSDDLVTYLGQKLRQLWHWLGAADIPADPPYGGASPLPDPALRDQQEQARLHQLRQELLAELAQQRAEAAAREATRAQELAQLRQQLSQAGQPAAERQAEQAAKAALEESLRTARTELTTRNQELDARIQQLEQLLAQVRQPTPSPTLSSKPLTPAPRPAPMRTAARSAPPKPAYRRLYQVERWGLVALAVGMLGAGGFGLSRWLHAPKSKPLTTAPRRTAPENQAATDTQDQTPAPVIVYDTLAPAPSEGDLGATHTATEEEGEAGATPALLVHDAPLHVDSATRRPEPSHVAAPADSAATSPAP